MLLTTKHFGEIEVTEGSIIRFDEGLPGFEHLKEFTLVGSGDETSPFKWLQCVNEPQMAFAIANPFMIVKDYDFELSDAEAVRLGIKSQEDLVVYSIVVVPEDLTKISMNLKAPLIINSRSNKGEQIILDTDKYAVRHYILDELRRQEDSADAGADKEKGSDDCNK
jgi:flagellar assembly factor FliW